MFLAKTREKKGVYNFLVQNLSKLGFHFFGKKNYTKSKWFQSLMKFNMYFAPQKDLIQGDT